MCGKDVLSYGKDVSQMYVRIRLAEQSKLYVGIEVCVAAPLHVSEVVHACVRALESVDHDCRGMAAKPCFRPSSAVS